MDVFISNINAENNYQFMSQCCSGEESSLEYSWRVTFSGLRKSHWNGSFTDPQTLPKALHIWQNIEDKKKKKMHAGMKCFLSPLDLCEVSKELIDCDREGLPNIDQLCDCSFSRLKAPLHRLQWQWLRKPCSIASPYYWAVFTHFSQCQTRQIANMWD